MSVPPRAVQNHAPPEPQPVATAKFIRRADDPCRLQAAARFARACEQTGTTIAAVARAWGVVESIVREVRDGAKPLTGERIEAMPAAARRAFAQSIIDDADDEAPLSRMPLSRHGHVIGRAVGVVHGEILEAEADGVVDEEERKRVLRAAVVAETSAHTLVRELTRSGR